MEIIFVVVYILSVVFVVYSSTLFVRKNQGFIRISDLIYISLLSLLPMLNTIISVAIFITLFCDSKYDKKLF